MKKSEFTALVNAAVDKRVKQIVEKQVKYEVKKRVDEIFINMGKEALLGETTKRPRKTSLNDIINGTSPARKPKRRVRKTGNPIRDALNETIGGIPPESGDGYNGYDGFGQVIPSQVSSLAAAGITGTDQELREIAAVQTMQAANRTSDQIPAHLLNALTRDYSGLMENLNNRSGPALGGGSMVGAPIVGKQDYTFLDDMSPQQLASQGINPGMAQSVIPQQSQTVEQVVPVAYNTQIQNPHPVPMPAQIYPTEPTQAAPAPPGLKPPVEEYTP